ncbi:MAG: enoyl-CoA hydratase/isomerase family protein [Sporichthyaceae bacterium]
MSEGLAATPRLEKDGSVAIVVLGSGENRFNGASIAAIDALLDEVEAGGYTALVTTAEGKIFSNGFDTPWMAARPQQAGPTIAAGEALCARVLALGIPTVAALQGHAFAGGLIFALAHDVRIMRADRGFLCLPEVTFNAVFTTGMIALINAHLAPAVARKAMVLGHRFTADEALACNMIEHAVPVDEVLPRALAVARSLAGNDPAGMSALKRAVHAETLALLGRPTPPNLVEALLAHEKR